MASLVWTTRQKYKITNQLLNSKDIITWNIKNIILKLPVFFQHCLLLVSRFLFSDISTLSSNPRSHSDIGFLSLKLLIMTSVQSANTTHCRRINTKHTLQGSWPVALTHTVRNGHNPGTNKATQYRPSISPPGNCLRNGIEIMRFGWGSAVASLNAVNAVNVHTGFSVCTNINVFVICLCRVGRLKRLNGFICYCTFALLIAML